MTEDEFWTATDQLKLIHQWARARYVAPKALLLAVLLRVIVSTSHTVMLPGPPAPASLNMGIVLVGRSGAGKGVTDKLARTVWPADIREEGAGSGQGIEDLFKETKDPADRITSALFTVSEIDRFAALHAGQGNTTRATFKAGLTGDRMGGRGATTATTRAVPADSYRLGLSISAQYGHTGVLLDDVTGGTPQRLVWGSVTDPTIPDTPGPEPEHALDTKLPAWALADKPVLIQYGTPEIAEYVAAGLLANQRGELNAIDGHRTLTRLKVAAALAIMDHRMVISTLDWRLSAHIMAKSDATRASLLEYDRQAARAKVRDRAQARAEGDKVYDDRRLEQVRRSILNFLETDGEHAEGKLRKRFGSAEKRLMVDAALPLLESEGLILSRPGEYNGSKTTYWSRVTEVVTPQNSSSEGVTELVTRDHSAVVTDLDSRRSQDADVPKPSASKWLAAHLDALRAGGQTTVESFAVLDAGEAAGHRRSAISTVASRSPDITVIDRTETGSVWAIVPGEQRTHESAATWVSNYLDSLAAGEVIDKATMRTASAAANHNWSVVCNAVRDSGRVQSEIPESGSQSRRDRVWRLNRDEEVGA